MGFHNFVRPVGPVVGLFLLACGFSVVAQTPPQGGTVLKEIERTQPPKPAARPAPALEVPQEPRELQDTKIKVTVRDFQISGATLIPPEELKEEVKSYIGRELTLSDLRRAALRVSDAYRRKGLFARALIPQQRIQSGVVQIAVIEGRLSAVEVESLPGARISSARARNYILAGQAIGDPLHPEAVQSGLRNLNEVPGVAATGVLQPGEKEGDVKMQLRMDNTPLIASSIYLDNYGLKSTGVARASGYAQINSPLNFGDQITLLGVGTSGSDYLRGGYSVPIGYQGLRVGVTAARLNYHLSGSFAGFNGLANIFGASATQPLYRSSSANVFGSLGWEGKHFINDGPGGLNISDKKADTGVLSLYGDSTDTAGGGGRNGFNVSLVSGRLDLSRNAGDLAADEAGPRTNGGYSKFAWLYNRLQKITDRSDFFFSFTGQFAGKNLDSYEKLGLGGPTAVRAYPTGEALGDEGFIANFELRRALSDELQASVFYDAGQIRLLHTPIANAPPSKPNNYGLKGVGVGLQYTRPNSFAIRGSIAQKLGENPGRDANGNDADGGHGRTRAWIQFILFI